METFLVVSAILFVILIIVLLVFPIIAQLLFIAMVWVFSKIVEFSVYLAKLRGKGGLD